MKKEYLGRGGVGKEMRELLRHFVSERMHFEEANYECDSMKCDEK